MAHIGYFFDYGRSPGRTIYFEKWMCAMGAWARLPRKFLVIFCFQFSDSRRMEFMGVFVIIWKFCFVYNLEKTIHL